MLYFFKGVVMGGVIALPFGPVGFLCLQRSISNGMFMGLCSGIGAALADALYGAVAAFSLTMLNVFFTKHHVVLQVAGGIAMCLMGARLFFRTKTLPLSQPSSRERVPVSRLAGACLSIFALSLANPMTMIAFVAIYAGLGVGRADAHVLHGLEVVCGVFCGSMLWWVGIAFGGARLRSRVIHHLRQLQRIGGVAVALFGLWAFVEALHLV